MSETVLALRNVTVAYHGDITILNGLSFAARRGQVTGIIGPNGAGKSTILKTLFGFLRPREGEILLRGRNITGDPPHARAANGISFVPQNRSLFADLSVEDNLLLGCWPFRRDSARVKRSLERVYDRFEILHAKRKDPASSMSGGQQRFLELGRALLLDPEVILLDEPTAMIAPKISKEIYALIRRLADDGMTIVLVDQNVRQCAAVSDHLYVIELGRNKADGPRSALAQGEKLREMVATWMDYQID
jgi:branched-chain amino acid transport system ATP-binding protein